MQLNLYWLAVQVIACLSQRASRIKLQEGKYCPPKAINSRDCFRIQLLILHLSYKSEYIRGKQIDLMGLSLDIKLLKCETFTQTRYGLLFLPFSIERHCDIFIIRKITLHAMK